MSFCLFLAKKWQKYPPIDRFLPLSRKYSPILGFLPLSQEYPPCCWFCHFCEKSPPIQSYFLPALSNLAFSSLHTFIAIQPLSPTSTLSFNLHTFIPPPSHKLPPDCKESGKERREREKEREKERERPPRQSKTGVNGSTKG